MKYTLLDEITRYATGHLPEEACGLIAGSEDENGRLIEKVYYLTNVDHAEDHFTLDPKEQLSAIKDMRANGLKPLGNWQLCVKILNTKQSVQTVAGGYQTCI